MQSRCVHLNQELSNLLPATVSTLVHLKCCSSDLFNLVPCHLLSPSQPQHIFICSMAGFQQLLYLSMCQVHRHYSVSGIAVLLPRCLNSCYCFNDHAMLTCYLHLSLRLGPKPLQCKINAYEVDDVSSSPSFKSD